MTENNLFFDTRGLIFLVIRASVLGCGKTACFSLGLRMQDQATPVLSTNIILGVKVKQGCI